MTPDCSASAVTFVVDRVEDATAAVELPSRRVIDVQLALLPPTVREGDTLALCVVVAPLSTSPAREARLRVTDGRSFNPQVQERQ